MQYYHLLRPYLRKMLGFSQFEYRSAELFLKEPHTNTSKRVRLLRGNLEIRQGKAYFAQRGGQSGSIISSFAEADVLAEIPACSPPLPADSLIKAWFIDNAR
jgi:molybdopterin molybdotransferase